MADLTANIGTGSALTSNIGTGSVLTANLKEAGLPVYSSEYTTLYDSLTTKPSDAIATAQDTMVSAMVADGVWAKLDVFYMHAQTVNTDGEALKNWISPGTYDAIAYNSPAFESLAGFTGDGTTTYINYNWNPSVNGINFIQDSANLGCYIRTNTNTDYDVGCGDGVSYAVISARHVNLYRLLFNDATENTVTSADARGMFIASRTGVNIEKLYRNKVSIINSVDASIDVPNADVYSLCWNSNGTAQNFMDRQSSIVFAGAGLTQTDVDNLTDRFETYMDSNGKGVIL